MLPERTPAAEDAFVVRWLDSDDTAGLMDVISAAVEDRRPTLAARLVGLLDEHVEIEPGSPIHRAQQAARLVLTRKSRPEDRSWSELEDAWAETRRLRMDRMKLRQRDRLEGKTRRLGRRDPRRRR